MVESLMQKNKECYFCKRLTDLDRHHVFYGTANRKKSEKYGCWVYLCKPHHTGNFGVHFDKNVDLKLKKECQLKFEKLYNHEKFMSEFGRNWL